MGKSQIIQVQNIPDLIMYSIQVDEDKSKFLEIYIKLAVKKLCLHTAT